MKNEPLPWSQPARSPDQRQCNACLSHVMSEWENLTDQERLEWHGQARQKRKKAVHYFKQVNLRRLQRGQAPLRHPPRPQSYDSEPLLRRLIIRNRGGRLRLLLELHRLPTLPTTVWGALPGNRGLARPHHCPRLGWLPATDTLLCDITALYYAKHGSYLQAHSPALARKRIFIRSRPELDEGKAFYEEVHADIPDPAHPAPPRKTPNSFDLPSNALRLSFEYPASPHADRTVAARPHAASAIASVPPALSHYRGFSHEYLHKFERKRRLCAGGTSDNSPMLQRWVRCPEAR